MIEILQNIIINDLFKNCNQDEKFEKRKKRNINWLCTVSLMKFYLFQVQLKYCDMWLLYRDLWIFLLNLMMYYELI